MNECYANPIFRKLSNCFAWLLIASLMLYAFPVQAETHGPPPKGLRIMILSGEGALNNVEARTARAPIVEVQDENHKPVAGAAVLFTIHGGKNGAGGSFTNNSSTYSTVTNANGIAVGTGFQPNTTAGAWQISVSANYGSLTASTLINENNVLPTAPTQQVNTQVSTGPTTTAGGTHIAGSFGHGILHYLHWFGTGPGIVVGTGVLVGTVVGVVVATHSQSPTQITAGSTSVGAPAVRPAAGITIHFGRH